MKTSWEYHIEWLAVAGKSEEQPSNRKTADYQRVLLLDRLGAEGWEALGAGSIVTTDDAGVRTLMLLFKRPRA